MWLFTIHIGTYINCIVGTLGALVSLGSLFPMIDKLHGVRASLSWRIQALNYYIL